MKNEPTTTGPQHRFDAMDVSVRAEIDRSCREVVLFWYASSVSWLLLGSALALVASVKLHTPGFLADSEWLTFGRVRPAHLNTMIYGWASMSGMGTLLWLMARLCKIPLPWREGMILAVKDLGKAASVLCVALNEVSVEIVVATISTKPVFAGSVLIGSSAGVSIQSPSDVVDRNDGDDDVLQCCVILSGVKIEIAGKGHRCIDAVRFTRMDGVVDQHHRPLVREDGLQIHGSASSDQNKMQRKAAVGLPLCVIDTRGEAAASSS
jgi:hypothetical protein